MAISPQPQPQPARSTAPRTAAPGQTAQDDIVAVGQKSDTETLNAIQKNPIFDFLFKGEIKKEERHDKIHAFLMAGLIDSKATPEDMDRRRQWLREMNAATQVIRKQLGFEQAHAITSKEYADFQAINGRANDAIEKFEDELEPFIELADLFSRFGADGNLLANIQTAKEQKAAREQRLATWWAEHERNLLAMRRDITERTNAIAAMDVALSSKWVGKAALEAKILNAKTELTDRTQQLEGLQAETPPEEQESEEIKQVSEDALKLQNIGGKEFRDGMITLRDHTEETLARISVDFDSAVRGLSNSREAFIKMDRNTSDAVFALSILNDAVHEAETDSRKIAQDLVSAESGDGTKMSELDRMEREQRSEQILTYTSALTTFLSEINFAISSLRSGRTSIQSILRINQMALEQANTSKITGIANTSDAVTITIGNIVDVCNRAATQVLTETLGRMKNRAQEGSARLAGGEVENLNMQLIQMQGVVEGLATLKDTTHSIRLNTVDLLKKQFEAMEQMQRESAALADATTDAQRATFDARAGITTNPTSDDTTSTPIPESHGFSLKMGQP